jgi:hypothetical protein
MNGDDFQWRGCRHVDDVLVAVVPVADFGAGAVLVMAPALRPGAWHGENCRRLLNDY